MSVFMAIGAKRNQVRRIVRSALGAWNYMVHVKVKSLNSAISAFRHVGSIVLSCATCKIHF